MTFPAFFRGKAKCAAQFLLSGVFLLAALAAGCNVEPGATGTFEKTLTVDGPVHFELSTGSGDIEIVSGPAGQVHIRGEFRVQTFLFGGTQRRMEDLRANPPIEQHGNIINVGRDKQRLRNITINYRITVPQETLLRARSGSGDVLVRGLHGPITVGTGSGNVTVENIGDEVEATTGSGDVRATDVAGPLEATTGSGDMQLTSIRGAIRTRTGSGNVIISRPGDRAQASTGSGDVRVSDAAADLRLSTSSGDLTIEGNPSAQSYWDLQTSSGEIRIDVSDSASFRLDARTSSGYLDTKIPLTIEEKSRKSLRARAGSGAARIQAETTSGDIRIR
ncbi:MAG: DUF4097 domain-containing protein [Acidobacteria bacterium]|nr:DUF4097 domain-containing protein [Acidobacteriota bacterium]MCL5289340.1 DUF4097 domain-containing protein [Acidobacteriota bacterium]